MLGIKNPKAKLTEKAVKAIRKKLAKFGDNSEGITAFCRQLAKQYGVSQSTILTIRYNRFWKHL